MTNNSESYEDLKKWADIVIERWINRMKRLHVHNTYALMRSFSSQMSLDAQGNVQKITFAFLYYGKFVDMGVGKGTNISQVGGTNRVKKPWYSSSLRKEIQKLGSVMAERYGIEALNAIKVITNKV